MLVNNANLKSLYTGFSAAFQGAFSAVKPTYEMIATVVPSTTASQEYGWLGQLPRIREWIGDRHVQSISASGYTIKNRSFEQTVGVLRDHIEDDNIGIYAPLFASMGKAAASFPDELVWPMLAAGLTTPCYDGQYFFDTDHPVLSATGQETSVSNFATGASPTWYLADLSQILKPVILQMRRPFNGIIRKDGETDDNVFHSREFHYGMDCRCNVGFGFWQFAYASKLTLNGDNYASARAALTSLKGDFGRPLGIRPTHLIVPPSLEQAGLKILKNSLTTGGETNEWMGTAELVVSPWLS